jgi:hypothetical protein
MDALDDGPVEMFCLLAAIIKSNNRDVDVRSVEDPIAVTDTKEDVSTLLDSFQHLSASAPAYALCGEEPGATASPRLYLSPCYLEPVAAQIRLARDSVAIEIPKF